MAQRIRLTLPGRWFADSPRLLQGLVAGLSAVWAQLYTLVQLTKQQSRLGTTTDTFLDLASTDFFGGRLPRRSGESDDTFRGRIQATMHRERATRPALVAAAYDAGCTIQIFEPGRIADTGAYGAAGGLAWCVAGGWGSLEMPLQCLITATLGAGADQATLQNNVVEVLPAGGVAWVRISS